MTIIKQLTLGSESDDPLTIDELSDLPTVEYDPAFNLLNALRTHDSVTDNLMRFTDNELFQVAYDEGFQTYYSHNDRGESNEIVYLVKEDV